MLKLVKKLKKDLQILKKYIEIEFFNGKIIKLDTIAGADITKYDYLKIKDKGNLKKLYFIMQLLKYDILLLGD